MTLGTSVNGDTASSLLGWALFFHQRDVFLRFLCNVLVPVASLLVVLWLQGGFVQSVVDATHERPWLWAVIIVVVVLPLVLIVVYCCMSTSKVSHALIWVVRLSASKSNTISIAGIENVLYIQAVWFQFLIIFKILMLLLGVLVILIT